MEFSEAIQTAVPAMLDYLDKLEPGLGKRVQIMCIAILPAEDGSGQVGIASNMASRDALEAALEHAQHALDSQPLQQFERPLGGH